jgi:unsaturated chondroitin disaccharide hydrolase
MKVLIDETYRFADKQYKFLATDVYSQSGRIPRSTDKNGNLITSDIFWWTSGFFPGSLWYIYEYTKDEEILDFAKKFTKRIEDAKCITNNHDVGFMIFCSYGNGYRLTQDKIYPEVIISASNSLLTRFRPSISCIQSWDKSSRYNCPVIIDNMMNLEMLFWASKYTNDPKYRNIAIAHSDRTLQTHFRKDYSSYHLVDFDLQNGKIIKKVTAQGYADESAWARGQAWALYGFTVCYRETKDRRYLELAQNIAKFILDHPNLPNDKIPYWDFNAPKIPNEPRDASAAAIIASALIELCDFVDNEQFRIYKSASEQIIRSLASSNYLAKLGTNGGFLLMHSVGNMPANYEIDSALSYADYYYLEALSRYKKKYL